MAKEIETVDPSKDQLFCKPDEAVTKTESGLLLSSAVEKPKTATVINSGASEYTRDDRIIYKSYSSTEFKLNGEDYFLVHKDDVLGKVLKVKE